MKKHIFGMAVLLIFVVSLVMCAQAQTFIGGGLQVRSGSFSLRDIPDSEQGSAKAVGAFVEGQVDFKAGKAIIAPRALASIERNYPKGGGDFNQFDLRPELEFRIAIGDLEPLVAAGFNYTETSSGMKQINPIAGAGLRYKEVRASVYRFFPDQDNANARGILYRVDYTKKLKPVGIRASFEVFDGESEYPFYVHPPHPGYAGRTFTGRLGAIF